MNRIITIVDGLEVYLDLILIEYDNLPAFFVGKSDKNHYLGLCTDFDNESYLLVEISKPDLYRILIGKTPMREPFVKCQNFWEVKIGNSLSDDIVMKKPKSSMPLDLLPFDGAVFHAVDPEITEYIDSMVVGCDYVPFKDEPVELEELILPRERDWKFVPFLLQRYEIYAQVSAKRNVIFGIDQTSFIDETDYRVTTKKKIETFCDSENYSAVPSYVLGYSA